MSDNPAKKGEEKKQSAETEESLAEGEKPIEVVELEPEDVAELEEDDKDEYEDMPDEDNKVGEGAEKAEDDDRVLNNAGQLLGHKDFVTSICCSPTNPDLVGTGSGDETGKVWSLASQKELGTLSGKRVKRKR